MGIQDRDYCRERYRESHSSRKFRKRNSGFKYLIFPILTLAALWYGSDVFLDRIKTGKFVNPVAVVSDKKAPDSIAGGIVLKADRQGHFRGTVLVNNVPMPFLVDTGATTTTIPANMAIAAGLPFGRQVQSNTAGGQVIHHVTQIKSFKIGSVGIRNLDAHINPHLNEVLIGMNTLKYFHMTQNENTLTLTSNHQLAHRVKNAQAAVFDTVPIQQPIAKPVIVKKKVTCDDNNICKTTYSDR